MAYQCANCGMVWTLPKNLCKRCRSPKIINTSAPFSNPKLLSADDDGQTIQVLGGAQTQQQENGENELTP